MAFVVVCAAFHLTRRKAAGWCDPGPESASFHPRRHRRVRRRIQYSPTISRTFSTSNGSFDSLKLSVRCGCNPKARHIRLIVIRLSPTLSPTRAYSSATADLSTSPAEPHVAVEPRGRPPPITPRPSSKAPTHEPTRGPAGAGVHPDRGRRREQPRGPHLLSAPAGLRRRRRRRRRAGARRHRRSGASRWSCSTSSCPVSTASRRCAASAARTAPRELPVILFTGLDAPDAFDAAGELGANAWLAKPYQLADLAGRGARPDRVADDPRADRLVAAGARRPAAGVTHT